MKYTWVTYVILGSFIRLIKRRDNSGFKPLTQRTKMKTLKIVSDRKLAFGSLRDNGLYRDINITTVYQQESKNWIEWGERNKMWIIFISITHSA